MALIGKTGLADIAGIGEKTTTESTTSEPKSGAGDPGHGDTEKKQGRKIELLRERRVKSLYHSSTQMAVIGKTGKA